MENKKNDDSKSDERDEDTPGQESAPEDKSRGDFRMPDFENLTVPKVEEFDFSTLENLEVPKVEEFDFSTLENLEIPNLEGSQVLDFDWDSIPEPDWDNLPKTDWDNLPSAELPVASTPAEPEPEPSPTLTAADVAKWMADYVNAHGKLQQKIAYLYINKKFGRRFTTVRKRHRSVSQEVLEEFEKLVGDTVVWVFPKKYWRKRKPTDPSGRLVMK